MTGDYVPQWATRIAMALIGAALLIVVSFAVGDRVSLGNTVYTNSTRLTRLETQQEQMAVQLNDINTKLDRIFNCQIEQQLGRTCNN